MTLATEIIFFLSPRAKSKSHNPNKTNNPPAAEEVASNPVAEMVNTMSEALAGKKIVGGRPD